MNFEIEKSAFLSSIQKVQSIVEKKQTITLLSNVKLSADNDQLEVIATDLEVGIRDVTTVQVIEPGSITVSAKILYDILKELPSDRIKFSTEENNWIRINCGFSQSGLLAHRTKIIPNYPKSAKARSSISLGISLIP